MKKICILVSVFISVCFSGYSQPIERRDTIQNTVVIFRQNVVTIARVGGLTSYQDYMELLKNNTNDPHTFNQFQTTAFHQAHTGYCKERLKNAIIAAVPKDRLEGVARIDMGIILSLSGHIELITVFPSKEMERQWTAVDYYKMDKTLKGAIFYAPWNVPIPYCYFHESIPIAN